MISVTQQEPATAAASSSTPVEPTELVSVIVGLVAGDA
jgi:hypothetical protein